jgi:putative intracellular protease/amidase
MSGNVYGVIPQRGNMGRKAVVISADKFEDMELYVPVFRLVEAGWRVDIAAPEQGKITGESNWYYVMANKTIDEIVPTTMTSSSSRAGRPKERRRPFAQTKRRRRLLDHSFETINRLPQFATGRGFLPTPISCAGES